MTTITDRASFDALTNDGQEVAGLYAYSKLDPLIDLACLVAADFFRRPHLYTRIDDDDLRGDNDGMAGRLARLGSRIGSEEWYPSPAQRRLMYEPVFGPFDQTGAETGDFARLRDGLLTAAAAYAEWSQATGIPMLLERVRTEHRPLREYLNGVSGATVTWSRGKALPALADGEAYRVLGDARVIAVFGLTRAPRDGWPYLEDANGDKVVEEVSKALAAPERRLTRESFSALQRVALRGSEALAAVQRFDERQDDEALTALITRCYTWHAALKAWRPPIGGR
jgi:hypothetical protein